MRVTEHRRRFRTTGRFDLHAGQWEIFTRESTRESGAVAFEGDDKQHPAGGRVGKPRLTPVARVTSHPGPRESLSAS